jgi:RNA polymerase sigma factor (TIGR02999 family)
VKQKNVAGMKPAHFRAAVANIMRRVLVDYARARKTAKRGGSRRRLPLDGLLACMENHSADLLMLDEALDRLATFDERKCHVVVLRFFGGLTMEEVAAALQVRLRTVERDWTAAKAWLRTELNRE